MISPFRLIAILLAIGGCYWGVLLAGLITQENAIRSLVYGPGYVVTAGYLVRAFCNVSVGWRRAIWIVSAIVQGTWLMFVGLGDILNGKLQLPNLWWLVTTVVSVYCAIADARLKQEPAVQRPTTLKNT
jgi:hypothetical protein